MTDLHFRTIPSRPVVWRGVHFRSSLECRWAAMFEALGVRWQYEPERYGIGLNRSYLPDFLLTFRATEPHQRPGTILVEVKPVGAVTDLALEKARLLRHFHSRPIAILEGSPWPDGYRLHVEAETDRYLFAEFGRCRRCRRLCWIAGDDPGFWDAWGTLGNRSGCDHDSCPTPLDASTYRAAAVLFKVGLPLPADDLDFDPCDQAR